MISSNGKNHPRHQFESLLAQQRRDPGSDLSFGLQENLQPAIRWPVREFPTLGARGSPYFALSEDVGVSDLFEPSRTGFHISTFEISAKAWERWLAAIPSKGKPRGETGSVFRGRIAGPVRLFQKIVERWRIGDKDATNLLGYDDPDFTRDVLRGFTSLRNRDAKDRIRYLFSIYERLFQLFRDESAEGQWLRRPNSDFSGKSPLDYILEGSMLNLIVVKQYLDRVSGL